MTIGNRLEDDIMNTQNYRPDNRLLKIPQHCYWVSFIFILLTCWSYLPAIALGQNNPSIAEDAEQLVASDTSTLYFNYTGYNQLAEDISKVGIASRKSLTGLQDQDKSLQLIRELQSRITEFISENDTLLQQPLKKTQDLLFLKGNIQQHEVSARKLEKLNDRDLESLSIWHNEWLRLSEELVQWQEYHSNGRLPALPADGLTLLQDEISIGQQGVNDRIRDLLEQSRMIREITSELFTLAYNVNELLKTDLLSTPRQTSIPLFSSEFWHQFDTFLWKDMVASLDRFFQFQIQNIGKRSTPIFLIIFTIVTLRLFLHRIANKLQAYPELAIFRKHPSASAIFLTILCTWYFSLILCSPPPQFHGLIVFVLMLAAARLIGFLFHNNVIRVFLVRSILFLAFTTFVQMVNPPLPVARLYMFCIIVIGMCYCFFLAYQIHQGKDGPGSLTLPLIFGFVSLVMIILIANGSDEMAVQGFVLIVTTYIFAINAWILYQLLCCLFDLIILMLPIQIIRDNAITITNYFRPILVLISVIVFLTFALPKWHVFPSEAQAMAAIIAPEWILGDVTFSPRLTMEIVFILYVALLSAKAIRGALKQTILPRYGIEIGVQFSIVRLVNYFVSLVVFIVLLSILGIELTKVTIFGSALGIGVGFGLQAVVNNFVSGLILLFERPIKIGDTVQISNEIGVVQNVGLRSTVIQSFGNAEIVVPNSDLVTGKVVNWSLTEKRVRLEIPVGVSYDSDVDQVLKILQECGYDHPQVMSQPAPKPLFLGFGESALNFELRVWLNNYAEKFDVLSELNRDIEYEFSQQGINIPFPQRDLHVKSVNQTLPNIAARES